jgi:hypothetical protein
MTQIHTSVTLCHVIAREALVGSRSSTHFVRRDEHVECSALDTLVGKCAGLDFFWADSVQCVRVCAGLTSSGKGRADSDDRAS